MHGEQRAALVEAEMARCECVLALWGLVFFQTSNSACHTLKYEPTQPREVYLQHSLNYREEDQFVTPFQPL